MKHIGEYCRFYRIVVLKLTLKEVAGEDYKNLSNFEHGRSSNIKHMLKYVEKCETRQQKIEFLEGLINFIEG